MRACDLFCGGGGSAAGLSKHVTVVAGMDCDERVLEVYRQNHAHEALCVDLSHVSRVVKLLKRRRIDLITASPPCQDFSSSGGRIEGARAELTAALADIIIGVGAKGAIMENVPEVLYSDAFSQFEAKLLAAGYHLVSFVINASHCGVPQRRKRAFVIATLGRLDKLRPILEAAERLADAPVTTPRDVVPGIGRTLITVARNSTSPCVVSASEPAPTLRTGCASHITKTPGGQASLAERQWGFFARCRSTWRSSAHQTARCGMSCASFIREATCTSCMIGGRQGPSWARGCAASPQR
jgi:DNA (cytosine-5)-methyltransferase 1